MPQHQPRVRRAASTETSFIPARPEPAPGLADNSPRALHSFGQIALTPPPIQRCACQDKQDQEASAHSVQFKLTVNTPGDSYEQEADATADQVLRMSAPTESTQIQRCAACEEEAHRKETSQDAGGEDLATADVSGIVAGGLASGGRPLDPATRAFMEPRFGHDFSQVRVHDNPQASSSAQSVAARAYTLGNNIAFRSGEFAPGSGEGRRLLAHELTHVVQQGAAAPLAPSVQRSLWVSQMTGPNMQRDDDPLDGGVAQEGGGVPQETATSDSAPTSVINVPEVVISDGPDTAGNLTAPPSSTSSPIVLPEVTVTGDPGNADAPSSGQDAGVVTIPETTVVGDPNAAKSCLKQASADNDKCTDSGSTYCTVIQGMAGIAGGAVGGGLGSLLGPGGTAGGAIIGAGAGLAFTKDCGAKVSQKCRDKYAAAQQKCVSGE